MHHLTKTAVWLALLLLPAAAVAADLETFSFCVENDVLADTDRHYTNGLHLTWVSADLDSYAEERHLPRWTLGVIERGTLLDQPGRTYNVAFSCGQTMITPSNIRTSELLEDDRPYAGILYGTMSLISRDGIRCQDVVEVATGIVGPHSYAGKTQRYVHELIGAHHPEGWRYELEDEFILGLYGERKWRLHEAPVTGWGWDALALVNGGAGNAYVGAELGGELRFGRNLPRDFGTSVMGPAKAAPVILDNRDPRLGRKNLVGLHAFVGLSLGAVARDITLDGNTWEDSHHVDREPLVGGVSVGLVYTRNRLKMSYTHKFATRTFKTQEEEDSYGSLNISWAY